MKITFQWQDQQWEVDLSKPFDISIPISNGQNNPNAFHIAEPRFEPITVGSFVGSVAQGSSANCENLFINAHGNGTHTECVGHITSERITIHNCLREFHCMAKLVTVETRVIENSDRIVAFEDIGHHISDDVDAFIIRTLPNSGNKLTQIYSGSNPPYLDPEICVRLAEAGIKHLLLDLPSVDREEDGGTMYAHKAFWNYPASPRMGATITEMVYVPDEIPDGIYLLNIQIASLQTDASPSKPLLFKPEPLN